MPKRIRGYNVYRNDQFREFVPGRNQGIRDMAKYLVGHTHMGEWVRFAGYCPEAGPKRQVFHYEYRTTTGVTVAFRPAWRDQP